MKRFLFTASTLISVLALSPTAAANPANWTLQLSTPYSASANMANNRTFNLVISVSSTNIADEMTVNVYQNDVTLLGTFNETSSENGHSWTQAVSVTADGSYTFKAIASNNNSDPDKTVETTVTVDTSAPAAPSYQGKTRSGNSYTLNFTAPSNSDVTQVKIFASTSTSFTANSSTQVGVVNTTPSQAVAFNYTAPDGADRFFAVQAFDGTGNGSALSGDAVTVGGSVVTTTTGTRAGTTSNTTTSTASGRVANDQTKDNQKQDSNQNANDQDQNEKAKKRTSWTTVGVTLAVLAILYAGYRWFMNQADQD